MELAVFGLTFERALLLLIVVFLVVTMVRQGRTQVAVQQTQQAVQQTQQAVQQTQQAVQQTSVELKQFKEDVPHREFFSRARGSLPPFTPSPLRFTHNTTSSRPVPLPFSRVIRRSVYGHV